MSTVRERLAARALPVERLSFPADRAAWERAQQAVQLAEAQLDRQRRSGRGVDAARAVVAEAERALAEQLVDPYEVRAVPAGDWERLVSEHPALEGATHGWDFDPPAFYPEMLAWSVWLTAERITTAAWAELTAAEQAALFTERLDVDDWRELLASGGLNVGERNALINTALQVNTGTRVLTLDAVGKGSAPTRS